MGYMIEPTGLFETVRRKRLEREAIIAAASPAATLPPTADSALGAPAGDLGVSALDRGAGAFLRRAGNRFGSARDRAGRA